MAIAYTRAVRMPHVSVSVTNDPTLCLRRHGQAGSWQSRYHKDRIALRSKFQVGRDR